MVTYLGYDTAYLPQLSPQGLLREGRQQGRIILTRDTRVYDRKTLHLSFSFITITFATS